MKRIVLGMTMLAGCVMAHAATPVYYVSPNGDDSAVGTAEAPLLNINAALDKVGHAGDVEVVLQPGVHDVSGNEPNFNGALYIHGTTSNPRDTVVDAKNQNACFRLAGKGVRVEGITFTNGCTTSSSHGFKMVSGVDPNVTYVTNCIFTCFTSAGEDALLMIGPSVGIVDTRIEASSASSAQAIYLNSYSRLRGVTCLNNDVLFCAYTIENSEVLDCTVVSNRAVAGIYGRAKCVKDCLVCDNVWKYASSYQSVGIGCRWAPETDTAGIAAYNPEIRGCKVYRNEIESDVVNNGAGIGMLYCNCGVIADCIITNNSGNGGAGIYASPNIKSILVTNCVVRDNVATANGGGLYMRTGTIVDCDISGNECKRTGSGGGLGGGAIFFAEAGCTNAIIHCTITNNTSANDGGAIYAAYKGTRTDIRDSYFAGNVAQRYGGAVYYGFNYASDGTVERCQFIGNKTTNSSEGYGGAICIRHDTSSAGNHIIRNCLFKDNSSATSSAGGAVYFTSRNFIEMSNCTFMGNRSGSGAYPFHQPWTGSSVSNCIVMEASFGVSSAAKFGYNCTPNNSTYVGTNGTIGSDPGFKDAAKGDYSLAHGSACINAGKTAPEMRDRSVRDLAGNRRVRGSEIDIGAYEYTPPFGMIFSVR